MIDARNTKWLELARKGYVIEFGFHTVPQADTNVWGPVQPHHGRPTMDSRPHVPGRRLRLRRRQLWRTWLWVNAADKPERWDSVESTYEMKQDIFNVDLEIE